MVNNADGEDHFLEVVSGGTAPTTSSSGSSTTAAFTRTASGGTASATQTTFGSGSTGTNRTSLPPWQQEQPPRNPDIELRVGLVNKLLNADEGKRAPQMRVSRSRCHSSRPRSKLQSKKVRHGYGPSACIRTDGHGRLRLLVGLSWPGRSVPQGPLALSIDMSR